MEPTVEPEADPIPEDTPGEQRIYAAAFDLAGRNGPFSLAEWVDQAIAHAKEAGADPAFHAPEDVRYGDHLLILSTCEYTFENARFIVLARIVPLE